MKSSTILWYKTAAANWDEALPIGNGRIGAMVFGNVKKEQIQINEDSIWSGGPRKRNNKSAYENLSLVRKLLFDEKISEAEQIVDKSFCGTPVNQRHYMLLGDLWIKQMGVKETTQYHRQLDISTAITQTRYTVDDVKYTREVFISSPDEILVVNLKADKAGAISFDANLDGRDDYFDDNKSIDDSTMFMSGGMGSDDGIFFASALTATSKGGKISTVGNYLCAKDCDEVTIILSVRTSFRHKDYKSIALNDAKNNITKSYEKLRDTHINDYQSLFNRACISLDDNSNGKSEFPTNERLQNMKNGGFDNKLIEMYHNFGRYLAIAGSREGTLPTNLQGIWNKDMWPAWGGKYTINANTEMNYWCVESCNLSELHSPLFDHIERMRPNGRETAKIMYNCGGFTCHHNTDIWGDTAPQDLWMPATQWPMGAAWLCTHIWEHYKFTLDIEFLKEKYETLKEASEFFVDFLIEDKKGRLVTCPSVSPENTYLTESGTEGCLCIGPSMDSQIISELFGSVISASKILGINDEYSEKLKALKQRLPKPEIGKYGQIKEWAEDYDEVYPGHRHISQLFALFPADMISVRKTPELANAARATIERRLSNGGGHTGWSRAWIINFWARLLDGEKVYENIIALLSHSTNINLFDMHPPFQIDGNFGGTSGITEALLQSHNDEVSILPAIPQEWKSGSFKNLKARGNFTISASWENNALKTAKIISNMGGTLKLISELELIITNNAIKMEVDYANGAYCFETKTGQEYNISVK